MCSRLTSACTGNREHTRVWRKAWLPGEIFPFCNLCPGRQGQPQEHHLLHPQLQLRGQFCLSCCTLISCFAMQLDNTSVPLKMLCNMERTFQACMPQMLGIPKHSILNQVAVANCVTSYWGNGYRAQRGEVWTENPVGISLTFRFHFCPSGDQDWLYGQGDSAMGGRKWEPVQRSSHRFFTRIRCL